MDSLEFEKKFNLSEKQAKDFALFCDFLLENNKKFNLTAIREKNAVYLKHFADSLSGLDYFTGGKKILEIGSGGGFPSVPLKICKPELDFTLVEATGKKCNFLNQVKDLLGFSDFTVINARGEDLSKNGYRDKFDIVTARAVASLCVLLEICAPLLKIGGKCTFYKSVSQSEIDEAQNALKKTGCVINRVVPYSLGDEEQERCLVLIEKVNQTPDIYPREYKQILKKPL